MQEIILKIQSAIVASNIDDVAASVRAEIAKVNTDLKTDEDFATAEQQVKDFKNAEDAIKEARDAALSEAQDVRKLLDTTDEIIELLAQTRLALDKRVKAQKTKVKEEITSRTREGINKALAGCDVRLRAAMRKVLRIDELDGVLAEATKGKKTLAGLEKGCAEVLANWTALIGKTEAYMQARYAQIPADRLHLFADLDDLLALDSGFEDAIAARIAADDERQAAEKARIAAEAAAKAEAELREKIAAEERAKAGTAATTEPQPMPEPTHDEPVLEYIITVKMNTTLTNAKAIANNLKNSLRAEIKLNRGA
nr:MAG TPA: Exonuclease [Caudoviricetes sp.]DAX17153.1 MAG TPA: Exonuclease [Caudoviricetes sp.]